MKRTLLTFAVIGLMMTSCKKDYTCKCVDEDGDEVAKYTATMTKKDANSWCDTWNTGMGSDGKCTLQ